MSRFQMAQTRPFMSTLLSLCGGYASGFERLPLNTQYGWKTPDPTCPISFPSAQENSSKAGESSSKRSLTMTTSAAVFDGGKTGNLVLRQIFLQYLTKRKPSLVNNTRTVRLRDIDEDLPAVINMLGVSPLLRSM